MPAEQRIIGGGLLMVGVAIVLILIFLFTQKTKSASEAYDEVVSKHWPAYQRAEKEWGYAAIRKAAEEILRVLDEADRVAVVKLIEAEATTDRELRPLLKLLANGGLEKNVDGIFEFDGDWFTERSHRALLQLANDVERVKELKEIRTAARDARTALAEIRLGSGLPLEPGAAVPVPEDDIENNPIYANDAELYRVLGVDPAAVANALQTKGDGAKARSARLRWNARGNESIRAQRAEAVKQIATKAETLTRTATTIGHAAGNLEGDADAMRKGDALLRKAVVLLGSGLDVEHAAVFKEIRDVFGSVPVLGRVLQNEADLLKRYVANVPRLGEALAGPFVAE
jgi:hypothetical protein